MLSGMDAAEFVKRADRCLEQVARELEDFDPDELDYGTSDGVVTLEFADRTRFVLNRQAGSHQMWFAAGARAWHYDWDAERGAWVDDRDGHELFANLSRVVSEKLGRPVGLSAG
jgi:CyaY protein